MRIQLIGIIILVQWAFSAHAQAQPDPGYHQCAADNFTCAIARLCIPKEKRCDGVFDCWDHSDERGCSRTSCNRGQFRCKTRDCCISRSDVCNHRDDCGDGSDELDCTSADCLRTEMKCSSGGCIVASKRKCDGLVDCLDGSFEWNCSSCAGDLFACDGHCIPNKQVCDGISQCLRSEDELQCRSDRCPFLRCEFACQNSTTGGECTCAKGYTLDPTTNRTCVNQNECEMWGYCDQTCVDTLGSYRCMCSPGYQLEQQGTCRVIDSSKLRIIYAQSGGVYGIDWQAGRVQKLLNSSKAYAVDYHFRRNMLYWTDTDVRRPAVYAAPLVRATNRSSTTVATFGLKIPVGLAVDWVANKLYVVDLAAKSIYVMELEGHYLTIVTSQNLSAPRAIALDPLVGVMFISDSHRIHRASMDGTSRRTILSKGMWFVTSVTADLIAKRIYYCDAYLYDRYIETAKYDGSDRRVVLAGRGGSTPYPLGLVTFENLVYWSDGSQLGVLATEKFKKNERIIPRPVHLNEGDPNSPVGLTVYHPVKQLQPPTRPCGTDNGGCSHLCIIRQQADNLGIGYRCACNITYQLQPNGKSCERLSSYLIYSSSDAIRGVVKDGFQEESFTDAIMPVLGSSRYNNFPSLDFDHRNNYIYFLDNLLDAIYRIQPDGSRRELVLQSPVRSADNKAKGIAVDWACQLLFFVDSGASTLSVVSLRYFSWRRTILRNLGAPHAIVIHPNKGFIFFSESKGSNNISRVNYDGTGLKRVGMQEREVETNGMAIDYQADRLYRADPLLRRIQHSDFDGNDLQTIAGQDWKTTFTLSILDDYVYFNNGSAPFGINDIVRANKTTGEDAITVTTSDTLYGVKAVSLSNQPIVPNHPCTLPDNGGCSHFCFPKLLSKDIHSALSMVCFCPYGMQLGTDGKTCVENKLEPTTGQCPAENTFNCSAGRCIHLWHHFPFTTTCRPCATQRDYCLHNSDCFCRPKCSSLEFKCSTTRCIPYGFKCDGDDDCGDSSDETECGSATCERGEFLCNNSRCISLQLKCDSVDDCGDGSDEGDFCKD